MARRPPQKPPAVTTTAPQAGELDGRIRQGEIERMRRQAVDHGFKEQVQRAAKARGEDPYQLLAEAIRRLLRGE
ncbi:hypothetical protein CHU95_06555 [Niveispirillum lacus]|uniref:Uncharacterized protein n=1 Tax=Niveispirillum lacus TaxID=1981099 RepID=A0A255Z384_9PROT|nr:hypothetical protein [Niveispirillum lacus]OYQ35916.1 hypothetical protein CHU95_06555 [Niveispirillum lacus]